MVDHMNKREVVFSGSDFGNMSAVCMAYTPSTTYAIAKEMLADELARKVQPGDKYVYIRVYVNDPNRQRSEQLWAEEVWALGEVPNGQRQVRRYTMPKKLVGNMDIWHSEAVLPEVTSMESASTGILEKMTNNTPMPEHMQERAPSKEIPEEYGEW